MNENDIKIWGIHNTNNENMLLDQKVIALGWKEMQNLSIIGIDRESYKNRYADIYTKASKGQVSLCAGLLYRFVNEAKIGDYVIYPTKFNREVNVGIIKGEYFNDTTEYEYTQKRKVEWIKSIPRTAFSQGALYEVGSAMSFFMIKNYYDEYMLVINNKTSKINLIDEREDISITAENIEDTTKDYIIKELSKNYKGYDLEGVVANLLNAMGYKTTLMPQGGDRGKDIIAYKDELPPRILVQVKSTDGDITETQVQSLKGAMAEGDYGLFVTLSNYTKHAKSYLEKTPVIKAINGTEFVELLLQYYDYMDKNFKNKISLKKIFIPSKND